MQFGSLKTELIFSTIKNEIAALNGGDFECGLFPKSLKLIEQEYPQLSKEQAMSLIELVGNALYEKQKETVGLVATIPPSFSLKTKRIQNVVEEMIKNAKKSILLTGYSVSEFVSELIDLLVAKSQKGVLVKIFFNDIKLSFSICLTLSRVNFKYFPTSSRVCSFLNSAGSFSPPKPYLILITIAERSGNLSKAF